MKASRRKPCKKSREGPAVQPDKRCCVGGIMVAEFRLVDQQSNSNRVRDVYRSLGGGKISRYLGFFGCCRERTAPSDNNARFWFARAQSARLVGWSIDAQRPVRAFGSTAVNRVVLDFFPVKVRTRRLLSAMEGSLQSTLGSFFSGVSLDFSDECRMTENMRGNIHKITFIHGDTQE